MCVHLSENLRPRSVKCRQELRARARELEIVQPVKHDEVHSDAHPSVPQIDPWCHRPRLKKRNKQSGNCAQHGIGWCWTRTPIFLPLAAPPQTVITMPTTCQGSDWSIFQPCARHYYNLLSVMNCTPRWIIEWHAFPSEATHHHRNAHTLARTHPSPSLHLSISSLPEGKGRSLHHHRLTNIVTLCNTCYTATMQHTPNAWHVRGRTVPEHSVCPTHALRWQSRPEKKETKYKEKQKKKVVTMHGGQTKRPTPTTQEAQRATCFIVSVEVLPTHRHNGQ